MPISIKSRSELEKMRHASQIVAAALDATTAAVQPGITTIELDRIAERVIRARGATPSFKGYAQQQGQPPYPASICASINDELVHGIPGKRKLREGDIFTVDVGAYFEGYHGDAALTVPVGNIGPDARRLLDVTLDSLFAGIRAARAGARLGDVSVAIQHVIEAGGYGVVREYGGHGVGRRLHEEPHVSNHGKPGTGPVLQAGMTLALEPMANLGSHRTKVRGDSWTVVTADGKLSAHFEHTVAITSAEAEILTEWPSQVYERIGAAAHSAVALASA